jgi:hypothetical protein
MAGALNADTFRVERSIVIDAPPAAVFPHIDDFRAWTDWSPYEKMDPNLAKTYSGPARGVGAAYAWVGKKAGSGRMEIVQVGCAVEGRDQARLQQADDRPQHR